MHIAIEGFNGVGKTTVCKKLAELLHFRYVPKPLRYLFDLGDSFENYLRIRDYVNLQVDNKVFTSWFYGLGHIFLYHKFKGKNLITDRHLASNYCWSGDESSEPVFNCLINLIGVPDYTFLLYASENVIRERLVNRDCNDPALAITYLVEETYEKMERFLIEHNMKYLRIDSSELNINEVVDLTLKTLFADITIRRQLDALGVRTQHRY